MLAQGVLMGKRKDVRRLINNTAPSDNALYGNATIRLAQDPGQAGKDHMQSFVRMLGGFHVATAIESRNVPSRFSHNSWLAMLMSTSGSRASNVRHFRTAGEPFQLITSEAL